MVDEPSQYLWSSYQINALGKQSPLCTPHPAYEDLGADSFVRQKTYQSLFKYQIAPLLIEDIRTSLNKGLALGSECFKSKVEQSTGRRVREAKLGRPLGRCKKVGSDTH